MRSRILEITIFVIGMAASSALAAKGEGYLGVEGQYGRAFSDDTNFHPTLGGWLLGGEDEWRAGAGGLKLMSPFHSATYGNIDYWLGGPMVFFVPNYGDEAVVHIGAHFGMGSAKSDLASRRKWFYFFEPTIFVAFKLTAWMGVGIRLSARWATNFSSASMIDVFSNSMFAGASLIIGEF